MVKNLYRNHIVANPKIMVGKPIVKGTRITVELILRLLASGMNAKQIVGDYPNLKESDIYVTLGYAAKTFGQKYEYHKNTISKKSDIFSSPPTRNAKTVIKEFRDTKKYSKKFLESLGKGLRRSSYFNASTAAAPRTKAVS